MRLKLKTAASVTSIETDTPVWVCVGWFSTSFNVCPLLNHRFGKFPTMVSVSHEATFPQRCECKSVFWELGQGEGCEGNVCELICLRGTLLSAGVQMKVMAFTVTPS